MAGALLNQGRARLLDGRTLRLFGYRRGGRSTVTSELLHLAFMYTKDRWTTGLLCTYILQNGGGGDDLSNVIIIIIITWKVNLQCPRNGVVDWTNVNCRSASVAVIRLVVKPWTELH